MKLNRVLVPFFLALFCSAYSATAQTYVNQVYTQLQATYQSIRQLGTGLQLEKMVVNKVRDDTSDGWTFYFSSSKTYYIVGACDNDCSDIDLYVKRDGTSYNVAKDEDDDDKPVVSFKPSISGKYQITMKMYNCTSTYCYQGFSIYSK